MVSKPGPPAWQFLADRYYDECGGNNSLPARRQDDDREAVPETARRAHRMKQENVGTSGDAASILSAVQRAAARSARRASRRDRGGCGFAPSMCTGRGAPVIGLGPFLGLPEQRKPAPSPVAMGVVHVGHMRMGVAQP